MDKWIIDETFSNEVFNTIAHDRELVKKWASFEADVTSNPYYHPKHRRIVKLKGKTTFPIGAHRYRKDPLRVVYYIG